MLSFYPDAPGDLRIRPVTLTLLSQGSNPKLAEADFRKIRFFTLSMRAFRSSLSALAVSDRLRRSPAGILFLFIPSLSKDEDTPFGPSWFDRLAMRSSSYPLSPMLEGAIFTPGPMVELMEIFFR